MAMLHVFVNHNDRLQFARGVEDLDGDLPDETVWLDLVNPAPRHMELAEKAMGVALPTREQMAEIEESSRLRRVPGAVHMTIMALVWAETDAPRVAPITFVLTEARLATLHHIDPQPFLAFRRRVSRTGHPGATADRVLGGLVDAVVERLAAVLRRAAQELDAMGAQAFRGRALRGRDEPRDDHRTLRRIGQSGHLIAKVHASLASLQRMLEFLATAEGLPLSKDTRRWARGMLLDVQGLDEYALFLTQKVGLLLDTTLGHISAEQNEIVKIVSVLSVAMFPPTLVASVYGMNFAHMPELNQTWGYPAALGIMVAAAVLPMLYFKRKGWL